MTAPKLSHCPECGAQFKRQQVTCCCGWIGADLATACKTDDRYCAYQNSQGRCIKCGTISPTVRGGGPWYCRTHYLLTQGIKSQQVPSVAPVAVEAPMAKRKTTDQETQPNDLS